MAAPRATQWIAIRNLAHGSHSHQVRSLHMTGPATFPSPALVRERPMLDLPRDIASLRAECRRRKIEPNGSKQDLIKRINADELTQSRAFSAAVNQTRRPTSETTSDSNNNTVRHFNTSRALKAPGDTSAIDFAFLPKFDTDATVQDMGQIRVPIVPTNFFPPRTGAHAPEPETVVVMKPNISTASADAVYLPMSEVSDGHAMNIDFHAMADRIARNLRRMQGPVEAQAGMMKQLWNDMVDDMMKLGRKGEVVLPHA